MYGWYELCASRQSPSTSFSSSDTISSENVRRVSAIVSLFLSARRDPEQNIKNAAIFNRMLVNGVITNTE